MATIVFLSNPNNLVSKLIRFILNSEINHTAIGLNINNKDYFLHSAWGGVQLSLREEILKKNKIIAEFEILPNFDDEVKIAESKIGQPYDILGFLGYLPVLIARKFKIGIHNPLASKSATVCSEFIIECDINNEIKSFSNLDPETIDPKTLYNICLNSKDDFKQVF